MGVLITGWHLPLFFLEEGGLRVGVLVPGLATTMAVTYWYSWLFNRTDGSSLLPLVAHNVEGVFPAEGWLYVAVWIAVAVALLIFDRRRWFEPAPVNATATATAIADPHPRKEGVRSWTG